MHELFGQYGVYTGEWVKYIFEPSLIALFLTCLCHSLKVYGWKRTLREFVAGFTLTLLAESTGVLSGAYVYPGFHYYVWATPFVNPASWVALVYVLMEVTNRLFFGPQIIDPTSPSRSLPIDRSSSFLLGGNLWKTILVLSLIDASLALMLDLVLDPLATIYNWWIWVPSQAEHFTVTVGAVTPYNFSNLVWMNTPDNPIAELFAPLFEGGFRYPTRLMGIPLINFIAWFVFVGLYAIQFRWIESCTQWSDLKKTTILWTLIVLNWPILSFLLISPNL
jgi:uncharacterized membrane protein